MGKTFFIWRTGIAVAGTAFMLTCGNGTVDLPPYTPVITFRGNINSREVYLPGHVLKPNTVELINGDTLRMYMYSEDYNDGSAVWHGDQLKIEIYGHFSDSVIDNQYFLMRLSRYTIYNDTYQIGPSDSLDRLLIMYMELESMPVGRNRRILIENVTGYMRYVAGGGGHRQGIEIAEGVIEGSL